MNQLYVKWAFEIINQEGYKSEKELQQQYNIEQLGC